MMTIYKKRNYIAVLITAIIACGLYFFGRKEPKYFRISSVVWTTEYHITYKGDRDMTDSINMVFNAIDNSLSMFNPKSTISRINANDSTIAPHPYITELVQRSKAISKESNGFFDPTVAPLVNLWGFGTEKRRALPTQQQIDDVMQYVGIDKISLGDNGKVIKQFPKTVIDFSSIAKGFACDEIGKMLQRNGITNYIIEIGGEISSHGVNQYGQKWHVSIDRPIESDSNVIHQSAIVLALTNKGIATSGNYRNYRKVAGKTITHIINPNTGYTEQSDLLSATIIAGSAADADAYATACMAMGTQKSIAMVKANSHIGAILISVDDYGKVKTWISPNTHKMVVK